jgi:peroxiredoxin
MGIAMSVTRLIGAVVVFAALCGTLLAAEDAKSPTGETPAANPGKRLPDPIILLIRDEAVRIALKCTAEQSRSLDELLKKHNRVLLAIRDVTPSGADETARPALGQLRQQFARILDDQQRKRLAGLILQAQGYDALLRSDVSKKLKLTEKQQQDLAAIGEEIAAKLQELQKENAGNTPEQMQERLASLQKDRQKRILAVLTKQQTEEYAALLGEPFDLAQVKPSPALAPEFEGVESWINSDPTTMESLRGKVVVVHFFAFGCINCKNNYRWYNDWQERLPTKGVAIIGIHTPETAAEADTELLRASIEKNGLKFPVAVDKQKKMWQAWYNGIWPSVYLVDKHGRVRYWWYGELDWQGAGNQKVAERRIEELLAEK